MISQLSRMVAKYISHQRALYFPRAIPLSAAQRGAVHGFFSSELLTEVRVITLRGERVANPDFYSFARSLGLRDLPDQSTAAAITFCDVVVSHEPFSNGLLFHELVHVEQYRQLGVERFSELYVRGFLSGGGYEGIPLERNAHILGANYESAPLHLFSVTDEVRTWAAEGRF